jgi:hypothetical protein
VTVTAILTTVSQRAAEQKSCLGLPPAAQKRAVCAAGAGPSTYLGQFLSF